MAKFLQLISGIPRSVEESAAPTIYDDHITIVASGATGENEVNVADATTGTPITLPNGGTYLEKDIKIFLNGDFIEDGFDYNYVGPAGIRTQIVFTFDLETGDRIRFRAEHASDPIFNVSDLPLNLWLKSDSGVLNSNDDPASDLDVLYTWEDSSGNANEVKRLYNDHMRYSATPSVSFNGYPAVEAFQSLGGVTTPNSNTNLILTTACTVIVVYSPTEDATELNEHIFATSNSNNAGSGSGDPYLNVTSENAGVSQTLAMQNSSINATYNFDEAQYIMCKFSDGGTSEIYRNGVLIDSGTINYTPQTGFVIGNSKNVGKNFRGFFAEVIVIDKLVNDAERTDLDTYIKDKYAIS